MPVARTARRAVPSISIVIATLNRAGELKACLEAVLVAAARARVPAEIVVVDDGSRDGTPAKVRALARRQRARRGVAVRLVRHARSRGPGAARNSGVRAARAPIVVFTDSDCLPTAGWLPPLLAPFRRDPSVLAVEGRVVADPPPPYDVYAHVVQTSGGQWLTCNLAVRRREFLAAGGLDERYFPPNVREDTDFAFALLAAGGRVPYAPRAVVVHPVRPGRPWKFLRDAHKGMYEALLFRKFPRLYLTRLKWIDGWAIPVYYLPAYAGVAWWFLSSNRWAPPLLWAAGTVVTALAWARWRTVGVAQVPVLLAEAALVPFVRLGWVVWGALRYSPSSPHPGS